MATADDRDALVAAMLALRRVAQLAFAAGARSAAVEALVAAKRAEHTLGMVPTQQGCKACGGAVEAVGRKGRPRKFCQTCAPPRLKAAAETREEAWVRGYVRRAVKYGAPVVIPFTEADVVQRYGSACWHCGADSFDELDHHPVPVHAGGAHSLDNVRPSCGPCNSGNTYPAAKKQQSPRQITVEP